MKWHVNESRSYATTDGYELIHHPRGKGGGQGRERHVVSLGHGRERPHQLRSFHRAAHRASGPMDQGAGAITLPHRTLFGSRMTIFPSNFCS